MEYMPSASELVAGSPAIRQNKRNRQSLSSVISPGQYGPIQGRGERVGEIKPN